MSARSTALRLLSRRDYTTFELRQKLIDKEFAQEDINEALRTLAADRLLDDHRAAAAHVRIASQIKGRGRLRIQRELEARGVDRALVRELLAEMPASEDAAALAKFLSRKRLPSPLGPADRRRIFQQLLRRGFPAEAIAKALGKQRDEDE